MTDNEIIQEATEAVTKGLPCAFLVPPLLEVAKRQKAEIENLKKFVNDFSETLSNNCKKADLEKWEAVDKAKSEAYREFAENVKQISKEVTVPYIADTTIQEHKTGIFYYGKEDFDTTLNKLLSNDMGRYDHYTDSFVKETTESNE